MPPPPDGPDPVDPLGNAQPPSDTELRVGNAVQKNFLIMSLLFGINHATVTTPIGYATSSLPSIGNAANGTLYLMSLASSLFLGAPSIAYLGCVKALMLGQFLYSVYVVLFAAAVAAKDPAGSGGVGTVRIFGGKNEMVFLQPRRCFMEDAVDRNLDFVHVRSQRTTIDDNQNDAPSSYLSIKNSSSRCSPPCNGNSEVFSITQASSLCAILGSICGGAAVGSLWTAQGMFFAESAQACARWWRKDRASVSALFAGRFGTIYLVFEVVFKFGSSALLKAIGKSETKRGAVFGVYGLVALGCMFATGQFVRNVGEVARRAASTVGREGELEVEGGDAGGNTARERVNAFKKLTAAVSLWSDPRIWLIGCLNLTFGVSVVFINGWVNAALTTPEVGQDVGTRTFFNTSHS